MPNRLNAANHSTSKGITNSMQQRENRHERANPGSLKEATALLRRWRDPASFGMKGITASGDKLGESRKLFRRAYRMVERFRGGAGADSAGEGQNKSQKHNGGPVGLVRLLRQAGRIDERKPFAFR